MYSSNKEIMVLQEAIRQLAERLGYKIKSVECPVCRGLGSVVKSANGRRYPCDNCGMSGQEITVEKS